MPAVAGNNIGFNWGWALGENGWKAGMDNNLVLLELLTQANVFDRDTTAPPGAPAIGDRYLIPPAGGSGDWAGHGNKLAIWSGAAWVKIAPLEGWMVEVIDEDVILRAASSSSWIVWHGAGNYSAAGGGYGTPPSFTLRWRKDARTINLFIPDSVTATSNANTFTIAGTNMPTYIRPTRDQAFRLPWLHDNGADTYDVQGVVKTDGSIEFYKAGSATGWTTSGAKGTSTKTGPSITYQLD